MSASWSSSSSKTDATYLFNDIPPAALLSMEPKPVASSFPSGKEGISGRISDSVSAGISFVLEDRRGVCLDFDYGGERLGGHGVSLRIGAAVDVCRESSVFCLWPASDHGRDGLLLGGTT